LQVAWRNGGLTLTLPGDCPLDIGGVLCRVRRLFDLDADSLVIDEQLAGVSLLRETIHNHPGLRVPGAWDGFETAVRAILGQQVSVRRATELAGMLCARFGAGDFPTPQQLLGADPAAIGMPGRRGAAITALARAVAQGTLILDESCERTELTAALCAIPGVGPWTAGYIGMRVARDPDAFPDSDWVVLKILDATPAGARVLADAWRPWRAYGVMYLWRQAQLQRSKKTEEIARKAISGQKLTSTQPEGT
jgi:3-methyladenine DNA glycosylase/8-oxoguanine DNA glycosylase